ncbi:MAG: helix-turn-helix transcriptional regulator [Spirochaetales bacterium]|uniref:Helix-turn-helix transcriptional regulator n=1 Tax=Candidatus Thalassospirochaeta sargassi TaxID=3119039 RepID=A0AAJ1IIX4_9SPIO|nr:helix-turn-helix transcriptional regulator [Spirochaetales bacterium]
MIEYVLPMVSKFYFKLGLFLGIVASIIGVVGFTMRFYIGNDRTILTILNYSLCLAGGLLVIYVTLCSRKKASLRYYSKQYQTMTLYLTGTLVLVNSGDIAGVILFLLGVVLAYRYSFLAQKMLIITAAANCIMLIIYAVLHDLDFKDVIHELLFISFTYSVFFFIYSDFKSFLNRRFNRMSVELDLARQITPFGEELRKRMKSSDVTEVDFTRKEYEVMVAMCFYEKVSNEELSEFMNISIATVKSHLNNIFKKTGIHSRSRLIAVFKNFFVESRTEVRQGTLPY